MSFKAPGSLSPVIQRVAVSRFSDARARTARQGSRDRSTLSDAVRRYAARTSGSRIIDLHGPGAHAIPRLDERDCELAVGGLAADEEIVAPSPSEIPTLTTASA